MQPNKQQSWEPLIVGARRHAWRNIGLTAPCHMLGICKQLEQVVRSTMTSPLSNKILTGINWAKWRLSIQIRFAGYCVDRLSLRVSKQSSSTMGWQFSKLLPSAFFQNCLCSMGNTTKKCFYSLFCSTSFENECLCNIV